MTKVCNIKPTRGKVYDNGIMWVKPCGVEYSERHEVHCDKYADRTCEYMVLNFIESQQKESTKIYEKVFGE